MSIANLQEIGTRAMSNGMGGVGKIIGSAAGILLLVTLLRHTFYYVPVGYRGVLMRGGQPIRKRVSRKIGRFTIPRIGPRTGQFKVKRRGIGVKIPGYHTIEKRSIQERIQKLEPFKVDCPDGQRLFNVDLVSLIPTEKQGEQYADYVVRTIVRSSEADDVFESYSGSVLIDILEQATPEQRNNLEWLCSEMNSRAGERIDRVGYQLRRVNVRERSLTAIQVAVNHFGKPANAPLPDNVATLPHPVVLSAALDQQIS